MTLCVCIWIHIVNRPLFRPYKSNIYTYMSAITDDDTRTPIDIQLNDCGYHSFSFSSFFCSPFNLLSHKIQIQKIIYYMKSLLIYHPSVLLCSGNKNSKNKKHWRSFGLNKTKTTCFMISSTYVLTPFINTIGMSGLSLIASFDKNDKIIKCLSGKLF